MGWLSEVVRHLEGKASAVRQEGDEAFEERGVVGEPLQNRVGKDQVEALVRLPRRDIGFFERQVGKTSACLGQHVGRIVEAENPCGGKPPDDQFRAVARPASEIDAVPGLFQRHSVQQIDGWPGAFVLELQILACVPILHRNSPSWLQGLKYDFRRVV